MSERKQASGAAKRKARRTREAAAAAEELRRRDGTPARRRFARPPSDTLGTITYATKIIGLALHEAWTDGQLDARARWRAVAELGRVVGLLHARAHVVEQLQRLDRQLNGDDLEDSADQLESSDGIDWPATSRYAPHGAGDA